MNKYLSFIAISILFQAAWVPPSSADTAGGKAAYAGKKFSLAYTEFLEAADTDNEAQFFLGRLFLLGTGVPAVSAVDAYKWTRIAQINGNQDASDQLVSIQRRFSSDYVVEGDRLVRMWLEEHPNEMSTAYLLANPDFGLPDK